MNSPLFKIINTEYSEELNFLDSAEIAAKTFDANIVYHYKKNFWTRVCRVEMLDRDNRNWYYTEENKDIMFSQNDSWVYCITINKHIVKIGETGNRLAISSANSYNGVQSGSKSRLGRYINGDKTDERIRAELFEYIRNKNNKVEFWAKSCTTEEEYSVWINQHTEFYFYTKVHKELEKKLIQYYEKQCGTYPRFNLSSK